MNEIAGLYHRDGASVTPEERQVVSAVLGSSWCWSEGPVLLAAQQEAPLHSARHAGLSLVAGARLDGRAELLRRIELEGKVLSECDLVLRAYETWGAACAEHLLGDWALAAYDAVSQELYIARDPTGNTGLIFHLTARWLVFASRMTVLLRMPGVPRRVNELSLAHRLLVWRGSGRIFPDPDDMSPTTYSEVYRLPPAHWLCIGQRREQIKRYWRIDNIPLTNIKEKDCIETFTEIYTCAVADRLDCYGTAGSGLMLSSGLDSSSAAAIAVQMLAQKGRRLHAYHATLLASEGSLLPKIWQSGEERPGVRALCTQLDPTHATIDLHLLSCLDENPIDGLRRVLELSGEPQHAIANFFWILAILQNASQDGVKMLLTGQNGNQTISWSGIDPSLELACNGRWIELWRHLHTLKTAQRLTWRQTVGGRLLRPLMRPVQTVAIADSAIHQEFAARLRLEEQLRQHKADLRRRTQQEWRQWMLGPASAKIGALWQSMGSPYNMCVSDPTVDRRVIEFCLGLPHEQFNASGWDRLLIRRAMAGRLPDGVVWNANRGRQSADLLERLRRSREQVEEALTEVENSPAACSVLNIARMRQVWLKIQQPGVHELLGEANNLLLNGLMVGLFLKQFN